MERLGACRGELKADTAVRFGKSPGTLFNSAMSFASISLFSLMFRALLCMKFSSSPSESESWTLTRGSGSDAGLFLPTVLEGNVIATFKALDLRPRFGGLVSTFMAFIGLLIEFSNPLHESSSEVASNAFVFSVDLLVSLKLLLVFAKPPSEPKLSQLSSEEDDDDVSLGTRETLRKLLRLILVEGGWEARVLDRVEGIFT